MNGIGEELSRLADLRDRGALSSAEFDEQKARLLGAATPSAAVPPQVTVQPSAPPPQAAFPPSAPPGGYAYQPGPARHAAPAKGWIVPAAIAGALLFVLLIGAYAAGLIGGHRSSETPVATGVPAAPNVIEVTADGLLNQFAHSPPSHQFDGKKLAVTGVIDQWLDPFKAIAFRSSRPYGEVGGLEAFLAQKNHDLPRPGHSARVICDEISRSGDNLILRGCVLSK